jgi:glycosyltransferase involved in cell wall biosynthesis
MIKEGFDKENLFVIHNSLVYDEQLKVREQLCISDIYKQHFGNELPNLLFIGRLTPVKKLDMILYAVAKNKAKGIEQNITFIGDGEKRDELESLVKELGLEKNVWFYGPCYNEVELGNIIYNADLCVSPGNVGLTAMHSLVFGTPVLTHNYFPLQMPEFEAIKEGETGGYFEYGNIDSLSDKINEWFIVNRDRNIIRQKCMFEIDNYWTPYFQIDIIKQNLK